MGYSIKDWALHYEINRTREMKLMQWLPLPIKLDGEGYAALMDHENGAAHFGVFVAVLEVAARCPQRGVLAGASGPYTEKAIARLIRMPEPVVVEALIRLASDDIGWVTFTGERNQQDTRKGAAKVRDACGEGAVKVRADCGMHALHNRTLHNKTEQNTIDQSAVADRSTLFDQFWKMYPRKIGRGKCESWAKTHAKTAEAWEPIMEGLKRALDAGLAMKGDFIPYPATWLNQKRWLDEVAPIGGVVPSAAVVFRCDQCFDTGVVSLPGEKTGANFQQFLRACDCEMGYSEAAMGLEHIDSGMVAG